MCVKSRDGCAVGNVLMRAAGLFEREVRLASACGTMLLLPTSSAYQLDCEDAADIVRKALGPGTPGIRRLRYILFEMANRVDPSSLTAADDLNVNVRVQLIDTDWYAFVLVDQETYPDEFEV